MRYKDSQIRKKLYNYLLQRNEFKSSDPPLEPEYLTMAANCAYSVIEDKSIEGMIRYMVTVRWGLDSIGYYDVLLLSDGEFRGITRHGCCKKHCDTWRGFAPVKVKAEFVPINGGMKE